LPNEVEPRWLPIDVVIDLNKQEVAETGEPYLLRDVGALEAALMKPQNLWHYKSEDNMVVLASSLLFGIARNHPFEQGNKRTALGAAFLFLAINGYHLIAPDTEKFGAVIVDVLTGKISEQDFIEIVAEHGVSPIW
jgi:death on curing protein